MLVSRNSGFAEVVVPGEPRGAVECREEGRCHGLGFPNPFVGRMCIGLVADYSCFFAKA